MARLSPPWPSASQPPREAANRPWGRRTIPRVRTRRAERNGVEVNKLDGPDQYELVDSDGDPVVLTIPNPVLSEMIVYLWRRFGTLHGFLITDLTKKH